MNRRMRAVAVGAITTAAGIGVGVLGAGVALAHATIITGSSVCQADGTYTVTWKAENDFNLTEHVTLNSSTGGGTLTGLPADIDASPGLPYAFAILTQTNVAGNQTSASLTVDSTWTDNFGQIATATISLAGTCKPTATPVAPTVSVKTVCGVKDTFTAGPTPGVAYMPTSGELNPGSNPDIVTATPAAGYVFAGPQTVKFSLVGGPVEICTNPVAPSVVVKTDCGVKDTFTAGPTVGVVYTPTSGELNPGANPSVVTATPAAGYLFDGPSQIVSFSLQGSAIEPCSTIVTPVAPNVVRSTDCGVADTYAAVPTIGVNYAPASGTLGSGESVNVVATPALGSVFTGNQSVTFTVTGGTIEDCAQETTTTVTGVSEEPPTTVNQVSPPVAPEAPPSGLPNTGSDNTIVMLLGGVALLGGTIMLAVRRRRAAS
jgi:LPXTG-motif cell wall-anchored protein